jgi:translation initiation factor 4G
MTTAIAVDQCTSMDELTDTFEIIDKKECIMMETPPPSAAESATSFDNSDSVNNNSNHNASIGTSENDISSGDDSNNNNSSSTSSKQKYSREELIKMKQIGTATIAPDLKREVKNLLFTESSELDNTLTRKIRSDAIAPTFMNSNTPKRPRQPRPESGRGSAQGNRREIITLRLQSNEEVVLKEAENAWKPPSFVSPEVEEVSEEDKKTQELVKEFRSILNKLTPENFKKLLEKLKTLKIDTVDRLDTCISLVFEKAITEPNYASSYAQLCKEVADVFTVPLDPNNDQQKAVFKKRLITQCQKEFEKNRDSKIMKIAKERLKEIEEEKDVAKREELKAEIEIESTKVRKRAVGTVHFIGELYKIEMLTSKIMRSCITHLLDPSMCSEETLECLCKLLSTVGKRLEKLDKNKIDLSDYFLMLEKLADKNNPIGISSRIRFMIQDIIECRLNNWTPRKLQRENKPLTMNEIKQQVILENALKDMDNRDAAREEKASGRNRRTGAVNEDGWSTPYSKPRPVKFEALKLPIANDDIKLGQPSNFHNFQNYQNNRFAGLKEEENAAFNEQSNRNNASNYNGRFSGNSYDGNRNNNNNNSNRNNNNNNNNRGGPRMAASKSLQGGNNNNQKYGSSRNTNHNSSNNYESRQHRQSMQFFTRPSDLPMKSSTLPRKTSAPARPMQYSEAFIQERNLINDPEKVFNILKTSLTGYQHKEITLEEITEKLRTFRVTKDSIVLLYNWAFDQHDTERILLTEIICESVSRNIIMLRDLLDALKETIQLAKDLACDLPFVYSYIGQFLALPLVRRLVQFKDLLQISKPPIESNNAESINKEEEEEESNNGEQILKNVFKTIEQQFDKQTLTLLFNEANINFQSFLENDSASLIEFLKENVSIFNYLWRARHKSI